MNGFFDFDGYLNKLLTKFMYIVSANLLFLLFSVPVITVGSSATAMYTVLFRYSQGDEPEIIKTFFRAFKDNFVKSSVIWCGMLVAGGTLVFNYYMTYQSRGAAFDLFRIILNLVLIMLAALWVYIFPAISYFQNSISGYLQFSAGVTIGQLPQTVLLFGIHIILLSTILFTVRYSPFGVILLVCCGFSLSAYFSGKILLKIFTKYGEENI